MSKTKTAVCAKCADKDATIARQCDELRRMARERDDAIDDVVTLDIEIGNLRQSLETKTVNAETAVAIAKQVRDNPGAYHCTWRDNDFCMTKIASPSTVSLLLPWINLLLSAGILIRLLLS